jgi:hypothetical protein
MSGREMIRRFALGAALLLAAAPAMLAAQSRSGDLVVIDSPADVVEPHEGSVVGFASRVSIDAAVSGDVVVIGGELRLGPSARIGGDLVTIGARTGAVPEGIVGGEIVTIGSGGASFPTRGGLVEIGGRTLLAAMKLAAEIALLILWLLAAVIITSTSAREVRATSSELRASPLHVVTLGLVALTSLVLAALVFSFLVPFVVGIPLLFLLGALAIVLKVFGMIGVFHAVGTAVAGARSRDELERRTLVRGDLAMVVLGLLILGAIRLIPVVGDLVWMAASVFGVGVALATGFGRREPWFLSWRLVQNR